MEAPRPASSGCLVAFALITDVQFADTDNRFTHYKKERFYRNSLKQLQTAIDDWNSPRGSRLSFGMHLGDLVDGLNRPYGEAALDRVLLEFKRFQRGPMCYLVGNHELYNFNREMLHPKLGIPCPPDQAAFWHISPHPKVRVLMLDAYDISVLGWDEDHPNSVAGWELLCTQNSNDDKNHIRNLPDSHKRWAAFNGAFGKRQLEWLAAQLQASQDSGQIVLICSHVPVHPLAGVPHCTSWNAEECLALLHKYPCVKAVFSGHDHQGGYHYDAGVHHYVLPGVVETPPEQACYATVEVCADRIRVLGRGRASTIEMLYTGEVEDCSAEEGKPVP